ncbi:DsbA family oxidoreductase [Ruegeria sp. THAF33]|uniref:DsbA family oxidoreductase n=1 Tax=Ruegeria sp. THAF33 TaxID=2587853 RepID=UPI0012A85A01|nr:DsbA family oxidoreductase [Ruegeria sp. THAF33]QFT71461.1 DSBA-like thioredoxin domain protein [Ruegeria sp. THAF33]
MQAALPIRVDIVSDVVCPWCVIGYHQLAKAARDTQTELDIHWHPFELNPQMAEGGKNLRDHLASKYGTTLEGSIKARARLTEMGAALGFTFNYADDMRMYNTFRAHQLIDWAAEPGNGHEMKQALFSAFFTRRENVSDIQVLADAAAGIGLNRADALDMLQSQDRANHVRQKEQFWISRGVQGVPAMVFDKRHLVTGAQGEENYARILLHLRDDRAA